MNGNGSTLSFELDVATTQLVEHLARTWGVSKEEAIKRAVTQAEVAPVAGDKADRFQSFRELQRRLNLTPEKAATWQASVREGRR